MNFLKLILITAIVQFNSPEKIEWKEVNYPDFGFKIELPCEPEEETISKSSPAGQLNIFNASCVADSKVGLDSNTLYMASCTEYPKNIWLMYEGDKLEGFFRKSIDAMVKAIKGRILYERKVEQNNIEGRQVKILFNEGKVGGKKVSRIRLFLVRNKYYIIQTITLPQHDNNSFIDKFMNSFELIARL